MSPQFGSMGMGPANLDPRHETINQRLARLKQIGWAAGILPARPDTVARSPGANEEVSLGEKLKKRQAAATPNGNSHPMALPEEDNSIDERTLLLQPKDTDASTANATPKSKVMASTSPMKAAGAKKDASPSKPPAQLDVEVVKFTTHCCFHCYLEQA